ncbi:hypothetical protein GCM10010112_36430 [Actinoplanes lobatus]|uniref:Uncharacterized protein n=1 Tax=Actinoplanes lobatus TaxID=113568 RepID=A0A7W7HCU8_9ACTN|nr:hypothetical protein [Actinoplanes lobatus]MBB4748206.1 hypothetical protein [Actinoplanes lobatus]GGN70180.1 hypothetical protein GCM10010112_36430 [Actinoplanes lobatus]GIE40055.1 hypothetical protein Alo02nite_29530 [Actinoplanes lobatus]
MSETGWPLIPREELPPPIAVERKPAQRGAPSEPDGRQLSMFSAETTEPSPADLAGLLAGPGHLGRMGGTARVSVRVDAAWRVHVLVTELAARGLSATWAPLQDDGVRGESPEVTEEAIDTPEPEDPPRPIFEVRTAYSRRLNGLARAWPEASAQLFLSGPRMRLWVAAAGEPCPGGFALGLDPAKDPHGVAAALVRAGLAGRVSDNGSHWLITGRRRLRRLRELVGERPSSAPDEFWPGGVVA